MDSSLLISLIGFGVIFALLYLLIKKVIAGVVTIVVILLAIVLTVGSMIYADYNYVVGAEQVELYIVDGNAVRVGIMLPIDDQGLAAENISRAEDLSVDEVLEEPEKAIRIIVPYDLYAEIVPDEVVISLSDAQLQGQEIPGEFIGDLTFTKQEILDIMTDKVDPLDTLIEKVVENNPLGDLIELVDAEDIKIAVSEVLDESLPNDLTLKEAIFLISIKDVVEDDELATTVMTQAFTEFKEDELIILPDKPSLTLVKFLPAEFIVGYIADNSSQETETSADGN